MRARPKWFAVVFLKFQYRQFVMKNIQICLTVGIISAFISFYFLKRSFHAPNQILWDSWAKQMYATWNKFQIPICQPFVVPCARTFLGIIWPVYNPINAIDKATEKGPMKLGYKITILSECSNYNNGLACSQNLAAVITHSASCFRLLTVAATLASNQQ